MWKNQNQKVESELLPIFERLVLKIAKMYLNI